MPHLRVSMLLVSLLVGVPACQNPSGLSEHIDFTVTPFATQADPRIVAYRFEIINRSADTIWMPACGQRITPDVAFVVDGRTVDRVSGDLCLAIYDMSPVALAAGATYAGERAVPYQAGVRYVPSIGVGRDRTLERGARLQARAFGAN